jgi:hypothetical protein
MLKKIIKNLSICIILISNLVLFSGCGDSSSNDQGTSFTFFGWYSDSAGTIGAASAAMPIAGVNPENFGFENDLVLYAGMQNNLVEQFIRLERIEHSYLVPGGSIDIPNTSVSIPGTLAPSAVSDSGIPIDSSLPGGAGSIGGNGNSGYFGALILPRSVREFIALNRSNFPEPPFVVVVRSTATGVTSAGHRLNSNSVEFDVIIEPEVIIEPPTDEEPSDEEPTEEGALNNEGSSEDDSVDNIFQ